MKKLICLPLLTLLIAVANVMPVAAEDVFKEVCRPGDTSTFCLEASKTQTSSDNGIFGANGILNKATNLLIVVIGIAGVIVIIIGGIRYVLSSGDPKNINAAKDLIIYAIVGMVIAVVAKGIIAFVINKL